jgi:pescadillo protein
VRNAANRKEHNEARRKHSEIADTTIPLTEVVRKRYPRFIDAVRELPDCLSLICLFAALPAEGRLTTDVAMKCKTLKAELFYWIAKAQVLDSVFVSIKGIYYQISIRGERIVFLVPHPFNHEIPSDVDLRVFATYLTFNTQLLEFVLFKLYGELDMTFPPEESLVSVFNPSMPTVPTSISLHEEEESKQGQETINAILQKRIANGPTNDEQEEEGKEEEEEEEEEEEDTSRNLFKGFVFYVSREVQWEASVLSILSFGGRVERYDESNPLITHTVIDRPSYPRKTRLPDREYIQPQWLFDSVNKRERQPCHLYEMGTELPFHYSPFDADTQAALQEDELLEDLEQQEHALKNQTEEERLLEMALDVKDRRIVDIEKRRQTKILNKKIKKKRRRQEYEEGGQH